MGIKLYYFDVPGRGEAIRLVLTGGGVAFEDIRVPKAEWPAMKQRMPFGQLPALEVDGTTIAQSAALLTYAAKVAGMYPSDPVEAALADQAVCFLEDLQAPFKPTWAIQDPDERTKAQKEVVDGLFRASLAMLSKLIDGQPYVAGSKLTHGDIALFVALTVVMKANATLHAITKDILDDFPVLKDYCKRIASIDFIAKYYATG